MKNLILVTMAVGGLIAAANFSSAQTWTQSGGSFVFQPWTCVCSSADGTIMAATITNGVIFLSTDSGVDWNVSHSSIFILGYKTAIACSADGTNLIFVAGHGAKGPIYTSPDFGTTWISNNVPMEYWSSVASSASGSNLVAVATNGVIYFSTNMSDVWTLAITPNESWISVSSSADGSLLAAVATNGPVCVSTNAGNTWFTNSTVNLNSGSVVMKSGPVLKPNAGSSPSTTNWQAVACSADKTKVVAVVLWRTYLYLDGFRNDLDGQHQRALCKLAGGRQFSGRNQAGGGD
jgi:hypothetical protein